MTARSRMIEAGCRLAEPVVRRVAGSRPRDSISSLVIVKPASLGDVLMATPAIRALRKRFPAARIHFAVDRWSRPMVATNPRLDGIVDLDDVAGRSPATLLRAMVKLRSARFDLAIVLDRSPIVGMLPLLAGVPWRVGLDSRGRGFAHSVRVDCPMGRHESQLYLDVAYACGCSPEALNMEFVPSPQDEIVADEILRKHVSTPRNTAPVVAIHAAGGVNPATTLTAKRWPASHFASVGDALREQRGAQVVLIGGPKDRPLTAEVARAMQRPSIDLSGRLAWGELGAFLKRCDLLVANDTGAAHLAMAVGTPAVMIFGPTSHAQYGPAVPELGEAVSLDLPCSPCFVDGRARLCHDDQGCMRELEPEIVLRGALRLMERARRRAQLRGVAQVMQPGVPAQVGIHETQDILL